MPENRGFFHVRSGREKGIYSSFPRCTWLVSLSPEVSGHAVHLPLPSLQGALVAELRQAGSPSICPICRAEMLIPTGPDSFSASPRPVASAPVPPPDPVLPPTPRPLPTAPPVAAAPAAVRFRPRTWQHWALAGAAVVAMLLGGGLVVGRLFPARSPEQPLPPDTVLAEGEPPARVEEPQARPEAVAEREAEKSMPRATREDLPPAPPAPPARIDKDAVQPAPKRVVEAARDVPKPVKRRQLRSEEELVKELAAAPEIGIPSLTVPTLLQAYQNDFQTRLRVSGGISLEPTVLLQIRPDLRGLPVRQGSACKLEAPAAVTLQTLSQKLRIYLQAAVPRDAGGRPDPALLREAMRLEMRGLRPEWLRAEAIPTMLQLLMHEDPPLRQMLVELLTEIRGQISTAALAQRAVFDLSPEVRATALEALRDRPIEDARPWLLHGLRYPWAPAADHAAEALVALEDRAAVPQLVPFLKHPDPAGPTRAGGQHYVREVVRANHLNSCLLCHPPGLTGNEPVLGLDPVVRVPGLTSQVNAVQRLQATPGSHGYGGASRSLTRTTQVVPTPLLIRGDVTYLRQDFSVQIPLRQPGIRVPLPGLLQPPAGPAPPTGLRFDYLVRTRPVTNEEITARKAERGPGSGYSQREAVLFALRELTGRDVGLTTDAWQQLYPRADLDVQAARMATQLVQEAPNRRDFWLNYLRDGQEAACTPALASAIPRLASAEQQAARDVLVQRLTRAPLTTLREDLQSDLVEVRRAAALACGRREDLALVPDLIALLEDPEVVVIQAARSGLKALTEEDLGPSPEASPAEREKALAAWQRWWARQGDR